MRKISLILALILVLTCGVFAACSDDAAESSAPATSETSKTESKPADDSSEAPADDSSAPADESSAAPAPEVTGDVISVGASYTKSQLYRQGGAPDWAYDENAAEAYPDEDGKSLTDGLYNTEVGYADAGWAGFSYNCPDYKENGYAWIIIDLGEAKDITGAKVHVATNVNADNKSAGTASPSAEFFVSADGTNWTSIGTAECTNTAETETLVAAAETNAQFVKVHLIGSGWIFVSEFEVLGAPAE